MEVKILVQFSGNVSYNGHDMQEFVPQRTAAYVSQHDLHIAEMTVRETLAFSARCQGVGSRYGQFTGFPFFSSSSSILYIYILHFRLISFFFTLFVPLWH
jgi:ABC-type branched-subunit amino acid transport system ATPase component